MILTARMRENKEREIIRMVESSVINATMSSKRSPIARKMKGRKYRKPLFCCTMDWDVDEVDVYEKCLFLNI